MRNKVAKAIRRKGARGKSYLQLKRDHNKTEIFVKDTTSKRQKYMKPKRYAQKVAEALTR